jgi:hypothetical protein
VSARGRVSDFLAGAGAYAALVSGLALCVLAIVG